MNEIKFSPESAKDLLAIKTYITDDLANASAADTLILQILDRIESLAQFPYSGTSLYHVIEIETDYRFIVCENYNIFYRFENDTVYIIRILYAKRDWLNILVGDTK